MKYIDITDRSWRYIYEYFHLPLVDATNKGSPVAEAPYSTIFSCTFYYTTATPVVVPDHNIYLALSW